MEFEVRVTSDNPTTILEEIRTKPEFEEVEAEQTDSDRAFAPPGAVDVVIDFVSEPENIALLYRLLRDLGRVVIAVEIDEEVNPEKFILQNTQSEEDNLELVRQEPQGDPALYEYRDSSRGLKYTIRVPNTGDPEFEMRQESE